MDTPSYSMVNGQILPSDSASIPLADRGFRFGDGVFETLRIEGGVPYQWARHMARLEAGLAALGIPLPVTDFLPHARNFLAHYPSIPNGSFLRLAVSRGVGSRGYAPTATPPAPFWCMELLPPAPPPPTPYRLWVSPWRKIPSECLPVQHKLAQGVNSILALQDALAHGCDEALQCNHAGYVAEAASANLFWITPEGTLATPPLCTPCLEGTTRAAILRLAPVPVQALASTMDALRGAAVVFLTSTRLGVHPVAEIQPLGAHYRTDHPLITHLQQLIAEDYRAHTATHAHAWSRA